MGLDYGEKTVGVAISDELLITAQGIETIRREQENKLRRTLARIEELIVQYNVTEIVLGLPFNMNATQGQRTEITQEFADMLKRRTGLPLHLWDERLTSVAAEKAMTEAGLNWKRQKERVDMVAAQLILQGYLDLRGDEAKVTNE
jgi:putative Holliday junction resolvase